MDVLDALGSLWAFVSWLIVGAVFIGLGLFALLILRAARTGLSASGCALAGLVAMLVGLAIVAATFGVDFWAILGVRFPEEAVSRLVFGLLGVWLSVVGLLLIFKTESFLPSEHERVDGGRSFIESVLALRPIDAIVTPIFVLLPPLLAVRLWGLLLLLLAVLFFVGVVTPDLPGRATGWVSEAESALLVALYAVVTVVLVVAVGRILFQRGTQGFRDAGCFIAIWLGLTVIGVLSGFLVGPLRLLLGGTP
jgi:hypothetical protein